MKLTDQFGVSCYCILYLTYSYELISRMRTRRLARTKFQRLPRHKGLVAECG